MIRAPGAGSALVIMLVTAGAMALLGAPPWAMVLAIAVLVSLPSEERD